MNGRNDYVLRARKLRAQLVEVEDPLARCMLTALADALDAVAKEKSSGMMEEAPLDEKVH